MVALRETPAGVFNPCVEAFLRLLLLRRQVGQRLLFVERRVNAIELRDGTFVRIVEHQHTLARFDRGVVVAGVELALGGAQVLFDLGLHRRAVAIGRARGPAAGDRRRRRRDQACLALVRARPWAAGAPGFTDCGSQADVGQLLLKQGDL